MKRLFYEIYLFSFTITMNIYFAIFVFMKSDLSPNAALLIASLPIILVQFFKIITYNKHSPSAKEKKDE